MTPKACFRDVLCLAVWCSLCSLAAAYRLVHRTTVTTDSPVPRVGTTLTVYCVAVVDGVPPQGKASSPLTFTINGQQVTNVTHKLTSLATGDTTAELTYSLEMKILVTYGHHGNVIRCRYSQSATQDPGYEAEYILNVVQMTDLEISGPNAVMVNTSATITCTVDEVTFDRDEEFNLTCWHKGKGQMPLEVETSSSLVQTTNRQQSVRKVVSQLHVPVARDSVPRATVVCVANLTTQDVFRQNDFAFVVINLPTPTVRWTVSQTWVTNHVLECRVDDFSLANKLDGVLHWIFPNGSHLKKQGETEATKTGAVPNSSYNYFQMKNVLPLWLTPFHTEFSVVCEAGHRRYSSVQVLSPPLSGNVTQEDLINPFIGNATAASLEEASTHLTMSALWQTVGMRIGVGMAVAVHLVLLAASILRWRRHRDENRRERAELQTQMLWLQTLESRLKATITKT